jgi:hypothetical protein
MGGARVVRAFFWFSMITNNDTFWYLILADLLHTALLVFFFYEYKVTVKKGGAPILAFDSVKKERTD